MTPRPPVVAGSVVGGDGVGSAGGRVGRWHRWHGGTVSVETVLAVEFGRVGQGTGTG